MKENKSVVLYAWHPTIRHRLFVRAIFVLRIFQCRDSVAGLEATLVAIRTDNIHFCDRML